LTIDLFENYCIASLSDNHSFAAMIFPNHPHHFVEGLRILSTTKAKKGEQRKSFVPGDAANYNQRIHGEKRKRICIFGVGKVKIFL
jgi:hypothetical protein